MAPKIRLREEKEREGGRSLGPCAIGCEAQARYLSEEAQFPSVHGARSPANTAALNRKVGAHRAREPVTNATAVKPRVESMKLWLRRKRTRRHKSRPPVTSHAPL